MDGAPATFVLMGNFKSASGPTSNADPAAMRTNFAALAGLLAQYPTLQASSRSMLCGCVHAASGEAPAGSPPSGPAAAPQPSLVS